MDISVIGVIGIVLLILGMISLSAGALISFLIPSFVYIAIFGYALCIIAPVLILFDLFE